jgi:stalled ribosome rescue protein Dom34
MKNTKKAGIWMDHSRAFIMELVSDSIFESNVASEFTPQEAEISWNKSEKMMQNKEQHQLMSYYKKLTDIIRDFNEVLLFGPTSAKDELLNIIREDHLFDDIKIEIKKSDKMNGIEMHKFVKEYFK